MTIINSTGLYVATVVHTSYVLWYEVESGIIHIPQCENIAKKRQNRIFLYQCYICMHDCFADNQTWVQFENSKAEDINVCH